MDQLLATPQKRARVATVSSLIRRTHRKSRSPRHQKIWSGTIGRTSERLSTWDSCLGLSSHDLALRPLANAFGGPEETVASFLAPAQMYCWFAMVIDPLLVGSENRCMLIRK